MFKGTENVDFSEELSGNMVILVPKIYRMRFSFGR
jgi:hypothetical protein